MSTDPNMLAYLLAQGDQDPGLSGLGSTDVGRFAGGVGSGLYKQYVNPLVQGAQAAWQYGQDPIAGATQLASSMSGANDTGQQTIDTLGEAALHPGDTATTLLGKLRTQVSTPEGAGEAASYLLPGPGEALNAVRGAGALDKAAIWGGSSSPAYDWEQARIAKQMKAAGASDQDIYRATFDPAMGGGYWNAPQEWGQTEPWMWISDRDAKLAPGAMGELKAEGQRQFEQAIPIALKMRNSQGFTGSASDWNSLMRELTTTDRPQDLSRHAAGFMTRVVPELGDTSRYTLDDLLQHEKLYQAYPGLRDLPVEARPWMGAYGGFTPRTGLIEVGNQYGRTGPMGRTGDVLDTLLHEPSHAIQEFEGMPAGGGTGHINYYLSELNKARLSGDLSPAAQELAEKHVTRIHDLGADSSLVGYSPEMKAYGALTGEVNARLPFQVREAERKYGEPQPPFALYPQTGAPSDPSRWLTMSPGGRLYDPAVSNLSPGEQLGGARWGLTGEMKPRYPQARDLAQGRVPGEQLALALRRARAKPPGQ